MSTNLVPTELLGDLRVLIESARERVAVTVNRELVILNWRVGHRIHAELLDEGRAAYGKEIVSTLSRQLTQAYGRGSASETSIAWSSSPLHFLTRRLCRHCRHNWGGATSRSCCW